MQQRQEKIKIEKEQKVTKPINKEKQLLAVLTMIAALTTAIFIVHAIRESSMNYQSWRASMLSYFTIQSNIIIGIWLILISLNMFTGRYKLGMNINLSASVTTYILVTGVIYWGLLVPMFYNPVDGAWMFSSSNIWMHTTTPIIAVFMHSYIKSKNTGKAVRMKLLHFYIYPLLYIVMAILYASHGTYLYPMFNVEILGWIGVGGCLIVMLVIFTGLYVFLLRGKKKRTYADNNDRIVHLR